MTVAACNEELGRQYIDCPPRAPLRLVLTSPRRQLTRDWLLTELFVIVPSAPSLIPSCINTCEDIGLKSYQPHPTPLHKMTTSSNLTFEEQFAQVRKFVGADPDQGWDDAWYALSHTSSKPV